MKKRLLFLLILLIPFMVFAEKCDNDNVKIKSIYRKEKTENVEEIKEPIVENKKINLNLKMNEVGDSITYNILVENQTNEDYIVDENSLLEKSDYIEYSLEMDNDEKIIKAHKEKNVYLRVTYKKEVDNNAFVNGVYQDNKNLVVNLNNNEKSNTINPSTGTYFILLVCILLLFIGSAYIVIKRKKKMYMFFLIGLFVIPFGVKAVCSISLNVDSNVEIRKEEEFCFVEEQSEEITRHPYEAGMSWKDFIQSSYNDLNYQIDVNGRSVLLSTNACGGYLANDLSNEVTSIDKIEPCSVTTYYANIPPC